MKKIIALALLFPLVGCNLFQKKTTENPSDVEELTEIELSERKHFYVIDRNDVFLKKTPDVNAEPVDTLFYGRMVEPEAEIGDFYKVMNYRTGYYAYVEKSKLGGIDDVKLINSDLPWIAYLDEGSEDSQSFEKPKKLEKYISIELIEKSEYDREKANTVNFLLADTLNVVKKDGVTTLHGDDYSVIVYKDNNTDGDDRTIYEYEGQIEFMNQFLMLGMYYEELDYFFIDKKTGKKGESFNGFPYISPDKKWIISLTPDPYEGGADFALYSMDENHKIESIFSAVFKNWMPTYDDTQIFWSKNGYLYIPVNHISVHWDETGNHNKKFQYARIKLK